MDFTLDEEQAAVAELAGKILSDLCAPEHLRAHELAGGGVLRSAWSALAQADLLGLALPESVGGGGYGILEASLIAEQVGRHVAPVPFNSTMAGAIVLAQLDAGAHADLLRRVTAGEAIIAVGIDGAGGGIVATPAGDGHVLTGEQRFVTWAADADAILVAATNPEGGRGLYLVVPGEGVRLVAEDAVWGLPQSTVELAEARGTRVGDAAAAQLLADVATSLSCATVAGLCEGATRITAAYVSEREQFGARIGTFQAVGQRMADSYIDTQGVHLTARQAAWRLGEQLPVAEALHIAKFWAADAGHRVAHAAQHLHGGIGMDVDYPIHRYFRWIKVLELQLGSGSEHLRGLGDLIAAEPV